MKRIALALVLLAMVPATADAKVAPVVVPVAVHRWSCADVPFWVKGYSTTMIASTAANFGMTNWQIARLLRCFPKDQ